MDRPLSNRRGLIGCALLIIAIALFQGCGSKPQVPQAPKMPQVPQVPQVPKEKPPLKLQVKIAAAADANRGPGGKALPVVVRLYELKSQGVFATADFFSLFDRESQVLGADLIARDEVTLAPGQFLPVERPLNPEATYIGVVAAFRDLDHSRWRDLMRLKPDMDNNLLIEVGAAAVSIRHQ